MDEQTLYNILLAGWFLLALITFAALFYVVAPYGRHIREGWGVTVSNKLGWVAMESAAPLVFAICFIFGSMPRTITLLLFFCMWEAHYLHRAFIYPLGLRSTVRKMPVLVMIFGLLFNAVNGYLNGRYLFTFSDIYSIYWLMDQRFVFGLMLFIIGFILNRHADHVLRNLRTENDADYKVAYEGMYRFISCPNYLGEIIIWVGWAIATWSLAGLSFAIWTIANLVPRARAHHNWYRENFSDYPLERKALLPGLW
jgi:3-oxo-5-alpha-steroid 4-dehydrogenase 1